jgi:hypothetical protein
MADQDALRQPAPEAEAPEDLEVSEETEEDVKGGGGGNWSGIASKGPQGGGHWSG